VNITSTHHNSDAFEVFAEFPISIFPGFYKCIEIGYNPSEAGDISDRFTLNFDNSDNSERIASQLDILAYYDEDVPSVTFSPAYDSTGVSPLATMSIYFSEPVQKIIGGEIQNSDIPLIVELKETFNSGVPIAFTGLINEDKTEITIIPDQPLKENQQYFIRLKGKMLVDDDENVIRLDEENYFKTGLMTDISSQDINEFDIFPNPTDGKVKLTFPDDQHRIVKIFSASGKLIHTEENNRSRLHIDLSGPNGIYFLQVLNKEEKLIHSSKIIKF
jgi:hypothetical protein